MARALVDRHVAKEFFVENHLMGDGSGRTYGLHYDGVLVCAMQVRWKRRSDLLEKNQCCRRVYEATEAHRERRGAPKNNDLYR